jgi:NADH-quinone oxidoreductase subunit J
MTSTTAYVLYLVFALGAAGLYFLLPRTGPSKTAIGATLGVSAIVGLFVVLGAQDSPERSDEIYFYLFTATAILAAARVITHPKPVYSAIYFVAVVIAVAALLVLQEAEFLAVALVLIYAGAILVTYLFVIMLAQQPGSPIYDRRTREPFLAVVVGFVLMAMIAERAGELPARATEKAILADGGRNPASTVSLLLTGNTMAIGAAVTTKYVVALELAGVLLLISMVGAIALSRKRITSDVIRTPHRTMGQIGKEVEPF